jgi:translation initiation factor 5B
MSDYRSPIGIVVGHVDAGKTSLLDVIRSSKVASSEIGGITQQIGASFLSLDFIEKKTKEIKGKFEVKSKLPGILLIDTPGHEAFYKLRERGASMCDIAILVIDIIEGVLPQTEEVIEMLKVNKIPFVIALTKIDRVSGWNITENSTLRNSVKKQSKETLMKFNSYLEDIKYQLSKLEINSEFYFNNKNPDKVYSIIPVNSLNNEGISDLLALMMYLTSNWMEKKLIIKDKFKALVMEAYQDKKLGHLIELIIINGTLNIGDEIIVSKISGAEKSVVRNIFLGEKTQLSVNGACAVKIIASNLDNVIAGSNCYLIKNKEDEEELIKKANEERENPLWEKSEKGLIVMAETLGALDALAFLLKKENLMVKHYLLGKPNEKILERYQEQILKEEVFYHCILYFGKTNEDIKKLYQEKKIKLINNEIIYGLIEEYKTFKKEREGNLNQYLIENQKAILPLKLKILKEHIYLKGGNEELLMGVKIIYGKVKKGTPLVIINKEKRELGIITSIQKEKKELDQAIKNEEVCIRLTNPNHLIYDRHFDEKDEIYSYQNRESIENLKKYFKEELSKEDWLMVIKQKDVLKIE